MNQFKVKIIYKNGDSEEKILDGNGVKELNQSIVIQEDFNGKIELFAGTIKNIISEILAPDTPFTASVAGSPECRYCPYAGLCK